MAVKANGAEVKAFYNDKAWWPEGVWHEEEEIEIDGVAIEEGQVDLGKDLSDISLVKIAGGCVFKEIAGSEGHTTKDLGSFESYFKKWRAQQKTATFIVSCPKEKLDAIVEAIKAAGGKVAVG